MSEALRGHKLSEETKRKLSKTLKGRKLPPWTEEQRQNASKAHRGKPSGMLGKKHTREAKRKLSEAKKGKPRPDLCGEKNPQWKGGVKAAHERIRNSWRYKEWRQNVFIRDKFTCYKCNKRGGYLEVHHIKPFKVLFDEVKKYLPLFDLYGGAMMYSPLWDLDNGITFCKKCHKEITIQGGETWQHLAY